MRCRYSVVLVALATLALALPGCGRSLKDSCAILCEKSAECDAESPPVDECVATCKDLGAKDDAYAEGVDRRAECYDDVDPACNQLATCDFAPE
jgi:hypothetical protein